MRRSTSRPSDNATDNVQEVRQASPTRSRPPKQIPLLNNQVSVIGELYLGLGV